MNHGVNERRITLEYNEPEPERLDKFLVARLPEYSRSRLQSLIRSGQVKVNGLQAGKAGMTLGEDDRVEVLIPAPEPSMLQPEDIPLQVIFENNELVVIDKPAGMVVHPAAGHSSGTLVHAVLAHSPDIAGVGGEIRPGIVHRLDKDTSGIILIAKNDAAHRWLQNQFRARQAKKTYLALVDGAPPSPHGRVEAAIGRDPAHRKKMAVVPTSKGRLAVTEYHTLETFQVFTLLEVHPITGRTHQIRLHLAFLGCPIVGDTVYGRTRPSLPLKRHFLHAAGLSIRLPGETDARSFKAPLPTQLEELLERLRSTP